MAGAILSGAEPFSAAGGPHGALVLHGLTGSPQSMRPLAEGMAEAGFAVELPLLPGHGTSVDDLIATGWADWSQAAELAYTELASRCDRVVVAGLSMGGTITAWLATRHPEIAGIVCVNAAIAPSAAARQMVQQAIDQGTEVAPAIGNDVADPDVEELAYEGLPLRPLLSLLDAQESLAPLLAEIRCPALVISSRQDHVVPTDSSDFLAERVAGPVERVWLERSYHVATIDFDRDEIVARSVAFARKLTAA